MGIIISSFKGCGKTFLKETSGDKVKIFDAPQIDDTNDDALESYVNEVMDAVNENDIVFIGSSYNIRDAFNERGIDYDVFYPSIERRNEFIENLVKKRANPKEIMEMDRDFVKLIKEIDDDDSENCYKHKLSNMGEFIGNSPIIVHYIDFVKNQPKGNNTNTKNTEEND